MKVVFMGNPEIAKPTLTALHESKHKVISVVSNVSKSMGRGRTLNYSPIGKSVSYKHLTLPTSDLV